MHAKYPAIEQAAFKGIIGIAEGDITPPIGICAKNWGAGISPVATGIHQPLIMACVTFQSQPYEKPLVLITADLGWWKFMEDEQWLRTGILQALQLEPSQLMICLSHTHAGPSICRREADQPGGSYIVSYLQMLQDQAIHLTRRALSDATPAVLTWQYGYCSLAANRDLPDSKQVRRIVGFNPVRCADGTLLVGRITDTRQTIVGTIVNYACHPTTLAWENSLLSPDYIGSMRALVSSETQAPCLFLQGASGDLAPAEQYTADTSVAERHGRRLGFAVLATLQSMFAPQKHLVMDGVVESGAPLAVWREAPIKNTPSCLLKKMIPIHLPLKDLPSLESIQAELDTCTDLVMRERLLRKYGVRQAVEQGSVPLWVWRLGNAFLVGQPNEAYSLFQTALREQFPEYAIAVINVVNGHIGYLPESHFYGEDMYTVWQTPFAEGSLELLTEEAARAISTLANQNS